MKATNENAAPVGQGGAFECEWLGGKFTGQKIAPATAESNRLPLFEEARS